MCSPMARDCSCTCAVRVTRWRRHAEAEARLAAEGFNELPNPEKRTPLRIVI
jgi:hypothetical protein